MKAEENIKKDVEEEKMKTNNNIKRLGFVGDVHGKFDDYLRKIYKFDVTIQVGDFGFKEAWTDLVKYDVNPFLHKIVAGNHDDYGHIFEYRKTNPAIKHEFGDFGQENFHGLNFFFVRGGYSLDVNMRTIGKTWWDEEQLGYMQLERAINDYEAMKPEIMITHTLPTDLVPFMFRYMTPVQCRTGAALYQMFEIHKPKIWICGHFHPHKVLIKNILGTTFVILPELGTVEYDLNKTVDENIELWKEYYPAD